VRAASSPTIVSSVTTGWKGYSGALMCIRCRDATAPEPLGFCAPCAMHVRVEVTDGFARFAGYLEAWAAWNAWLRSRGSVSDELA
jgi:hypothetical protein